MWDDRTEDVPRFIQRIVHIASTTRATCWPSPAQTKAMRKLKLIKKLDHIAEHSTHSGRPWTKEVGGRLRPPKKGEVGKMEGSEEGLAILFPGASSERATEVWGDHVGKPFRYFLQEDAPWLRKLEYRVYVSGMRVLGVIKTVPQGKEDVSEAKCDWDFVWIPHMLSLDHLQ